MPTSPNSLPIRVLTRIFISTFLGAPTHKQLPDRFSAKSEQLPDSFIIIHHHSSSSSFIIMLEPDDRRSVRGGMIIWDDYLRWLSEMIIWDDYWSIFFFVDNLNFKSLYRPQETCRAKTNGVWGLYFCLKNNILEFQNIPWRLKIELHQWHVMTTHKSFVIRKILQVCYSSVENKDPIPPSFWL